MFNAEEMLQAIEPEPYQANNSTPYHLQTQTTALLIIARELEKLNNKLGHIHITLEGMKKFL